MTVTRLDLQRAILGAIAVALLAGIIPAGIALDRRVAAALEQRARDDLALAPQLFVDRSASTADALMMRAKDLAHVPGLADAVRSGNKLQAIRIVDDAREALGGDAVLVGPGGESWIGPHVDSGLLARTRKGEMPVAVSLGASTIYNISVAPVMSDSTWTGAAGLASAMDARAAEALSGLTRSAVVIIASNGSTVSTLDTMSTRLIVEESNARRLASTPMAIQSGARRLIAVSAPLNGVGAVVFARFLDDELAVMPQLRRIVTISAIGALVLALILGAVFATRISRPVRQLSKAAAAIERGEFSAPLPSSRVQEVQQLSTSFESMRRALAAKLEELRTTNAALVDRSARLTALQSDLMQRDRLGAAGRLVAQLAHEIRNPIASLRNCLELIRRRVNDDAEAREFADLAIDELLRMHELAEQMLDLNRPRDSGAQRCSPVQVARETRQLALIGNGDDELRIDIEGDVALETAISADALKQVLLNLVQNAREAHDGWEHKGAGPARVSIQVRSVDEQVAIVVSDNGPGIAEGIISRIFDPFFTTQNAVHGVGLGLFVAEGLVRTAGGRITAGNATEGGGARFDIELPVAIGGEPSLNGRDSMLSTA